eukprot:gene4086-4764_t
MPNLEYPTGNPLGGTSGMNPLGSTHGSMFGNGHPLGGTSGIHPQKSPRGGMNPLGGTYGNPLGGTAGGMNPLGGTMGGMNPLGGTMGGGFPMSLGGTLAASGLIRSPTLAGSQLLVPGMPGLGGLHASAILTCPNSAAGTAAPNAQTQVVPVVNTVAPAMANIVIIPAEVSEITAMTPVTAIPTGAAASVPPAQAQQVQALNQSSVNTPPYMQSPSINASLASGMPMPGSNLGSSTMVPNPSNLLKTIQEIPNSLRYTNATNDYQDAIEMKDLRNTMMVNIPSQIVAQQIILDAAELITPQSPNDHLISFENVEPTICEKPVATKKKNRFNKEKMKKFKNSVYQILAPTTTLPVHIVDHQEIEQYVVPFLMELGRALLMSGVPAHRLEYELTLVCSTFGIDGNFFSTPTGIFFSFGSPHTILSPYTHLLRIQSTDYNMERLVKLEELADEVIYGKKTCQEALENLRDILKAPPLYNIYLTVFSFVASSFAIAFFFNAGWVEVGGCSLIGLYVGLLYALACKWPAVGRVLEALSAFGGAFIASMFNSFVSPCMAEISTRNLVSGNARLMGAFACLLQLTFGIAMGTKFSTEFLPIRKEVPPESFPPWTMFLAIPLAAVAFAVQMKVHPRQIWIIIVTSVLGVVGGNWGNKIFGQDVGSFFGACLICVAGNLYARFTNGTSVVPIMSGIILLVPGSMGVKGLVSMSAGNVDSGIALFGGMFMIATSLTIVAQQPTAIEPQICFGKCSGHGNCVGQECVCDVDYIHGQHITYYGSDCQYNVSSSTSPSPSTTNPTPSPSWTPSYSSSGSGSSGYPTPSPTHTPSYSSSGSGSTGASASMDMMGSDAKDIPTPLQALNLYAHNRIRAMIMAASTQTTTLPYNFNYTLAIILSTIVATLTIVFIAKLVFSDCQTPTPPKTTTSTVVMSH